MKILMSCLCLLMVACSSGNYVNRSVEASNGIVPQGSMTPGIFGAGGAPSNGIAAIAQERQAKARSFWGN